MNNYKMPKCKHVLIFAALLFSTHVIAATYDHSTEFLSRYPYGNKLDTHISKLNGKKKMEAFNTAIRADNIAMLKALLSQGVDVNYQYEDSRQTPLHIAAGFASSATVEFLLAQGANPNAHDKRGQSPLGLAMAANKEEVVRLLLSYGARGNSPASHSSVFAITNVDLGEINATKKAVYKMPYKKGPTFLDAPKIIFSARHQFDVLESVWSMALDGSGLQLELSVDDIYGSIFSHEIDDKPLKLSNMLAPHHYLGIKSGRDGYLYSFSERKSVGDFISNAEKLPTIVTAQSFHYSESEEYRDNCDTIYTALAFVNLRKTIHEGPCSYVFIPGVEKLVRFFPSKVVVLSSGGKKENIDLQFSHQRILSIPHEGTQVLLKTGKGMTLFDLKNRASESFNIDSRNAVYFHPYIFASEYIANKKTYAITRIHVENKSVDQYIFDGIVEIGSLNYYQP